MLFSGQFSNLRSAGSGMCLALVFRRDLHLVAETAGGGDGFLLVLRTRAAGVLGLNGTGQFRAAELSSLK